MNIGVPFRFLFDSMLKVSRWFKLDPPTDGTLDLWGCLALVLLVLGVSIFLGSDPVDLDVSLGDGSRSLDWLQ